MKIKTQELLGPALDWAVASCLGWVTYPTDSIERGDWYHTNAAIAPLGHEHNRVHRDDFSPSINWAQGGPIIEAQEITIKHIVPAMRSSIWQAHPSMTAKGAGGHTGVGPTPLIAAMRCYVATHLGQTVELPENLPCPASPTAEPEAAPPPAEILFVMRNVPQ